MQAEPPFHSLFSARLKSLRHRGALLLAGLSLLSGLAWAMPADPISRAEIALFMPREADDTFWSMFRDFTQAACNDLGMDLRVYYAHDDPATALKQIKAATSGPNPVQGLVFQNFKQTGRQFLEIAEKARVPSFIIDTGLDESERKRVGKPRETFQYWLGEFLPENEEAGFDLANRLLDRALELKQVDFEANPFAKIQIIGLAGENLSNASSDRIKGLGIAARGRKDTLLQDMIPAYWSRDQARLRTRQLLQQAPPGSIQVIWAANDPMALGATDALKELGLTPGKDVVAGGVDWTAEGLQAVQAGVLDATVGGHFMQGAWAAVMLYDYFRGQDFAKESVEMRLRMQILDKQNIDTYLQYFSKSNWEQINFREFSKVANPERKKYNFGLQALLEQLQQKK
ncbi:MAG: ABC transporter substrate-binding protein [Candidatus Sericytochromatia bacterium]|nr:ABC transporter substrate-binding protein [Candidatus Sericytochromatia bacterium]